MIHCTQETDTSPLSISRIYTYSDDVCNADRTLTRQTSRHSYVCVSLSLCLFCLLFMMNARLRERKGVRTAKHKNRTQEEKSGGWISTYIASLYLSIPLSQSPFTSILMHHHDGRKTVDLEKKKHLGTKGVRNGERQ